MYYVYKFTNKTNGKIYIGKTNDVERRKIEHLSKSKTNENNHFYNAIKKYGFDNFDFEIVAEYEDEAVAYNMESYYIAQYQSNDKILGYNSTTGGEGLKGITEETRKKMSDNGKLKIGDKNGFFGKHHTILTKQKISQANTGNTSWLGKHHTDESINKISEANVGKRYSPATEFKTGQLPLNAKLTMEKAREIRAKFRSGISQKDLETEYNLSDSTIWRIVTNRSYKEK
jgi:group I intron endonuclease